MPNSIFFYRIARWLYLRKVPIFPKLIQLTIFLIYNCKVPYKADIGEGSFLVVKGIGVNIHDKSIIGKNCRIGIGCKIVGKGPYRDVPKIGDNVFIGPGAVLVGPIIIEDDVIIGANAVVTKSVPSGAVVGGIPAKIIGKVDSFEYNILDNQSNVEGTADFLRFN